MDAFLIDTEIFEAVFISIIVDIRMNMFTIGYLTSNPFLKFLSICALCVLFFNLF